MSAQSADNHTRTCEQEDHVCQATRSEFNASFPKAFAGEHEAQRNVSSCLTNGCDDAVQRDRVLGCAWRLMIIKFMAEASELADKAFFSANCTGSLTDADIGQIEKQADGLLHTVYRKSMRPTD
ncbi:hypothetical protein [Methylobacterium durans]|uniref:hypothetical protein n=1 Tax=Methylobacterium durans TaxID=2202825 RepID=UPI0013A57672|nr:hypothetical protein [Methylobacterium durans]